MKSQRIRARWRQLTQARRIEVEEILIVFERSQGLQCEVSIERKTVEVFLISQMATKSETKEEKRRKKP